MLKQAIIKTNPHLKNARRRKALFLKSVVSSTAIEGVKVSSETMKKAVAKKAL